MIEVDTDKKVHSEHIITDEEFHHHQVSVNCECNPDRFEGTNVYAHQRLIRNGRKIPNKYRTYILYEDNSFDLKIEDK